MGVGWGGSTNGAPPFLGSKIMNLWVFSDLEPKKCFRVPTPWSLYGAEWGERLCCLCTFQPFMPCWRFGDLGDPMLPTLKGVSGDVVTVYGYQDAKARFLQSLALLKAGQNLCQKQEMTVSTNSGLHE